MIETKFIHDIVKEFQVAEFIAESLKNVGFSHAEVQKTPLGEKIIIHASRPGLIVGRKGENIQKLTKTLKSKFKMENPQIEIIEVQNSMLNANIVAERIASSLERFGLSKFKGIGHKVLQDVMGAGALGIEITMSGKIPSSRAKSWRFYQGYLKKSGDIAVSGIRKAYTQAKLKTGIIGIQVRIMPPDLKLPDTVTSKQDITQNTEKSQQKADEKKEIKEVNEPTDVNKASEAVNAQVVAHSAGKNASEKADSSIEAKEEKPAKEKKARKKKDPKEAAEAKKE